MATIARRERRRHEQARTGHLTKRRISLAVATMLLAGVLALFPGRPSPAAAPSTVDLELLAVHAALGDLQHEFFHPVTASTVLANAWDAATAAARKQGASVDGVAPPKLDGQDALALRNFDAAYQALNRAGGTKLDSRAVGYATLAGVASSVHENHTYFINPDQWHHRGDTVQEYAGIGITLSQQGDGFFVQEVYPNTPAAGGALAPGDRFLRVDGVSVSGITMDQLVGKLRGEPGTRVVVELARSNGTLLVELTRRTISIAAFESRLLDNRVGYVRLRSFPPAGAKLPDGKTVAEELDETLNGFDRAGASAWVLDLRSNGGGYLDGMLAIASRFLPSGSPVLITRAQGGDSTSKSGDQQHKPVRPMTVLVNGGSASASEILSAALQEHGRATVVGEKTAGVANAANLDALPDGGGLSITSVQSLTPVQHRPLDGTGVTPDAPVAAATGEFLRGEDRQLDLAATIARSAVAAVPAATP